MSEFLPDHPPASALLEDANLPSVSSPAGSPGRNPCPGNRAIDGPDEAAQLAGDRGHGDRLALASAHQCSVAPAKATLRLPGDLTNGSRRRCHLRLLVPADPRRMLIAPRTLHQNAPRPPVAGLRCARTEVRLDIAAEDVWERAARFKYVRS